jgi:parallel beta-helix repeat protein
MSENVAGSVVTQNTVRNSQQRCIVIHGSHNVTVTDNVAFETHGHCYMLEDGGELDNTFMRNLGASTRASRLTARPIDTDGSNPSTFWISNPQNTFIGNVAAGSESSGFWFELNQYVRPPTQYLETSIGMVPQYMPLKRFENNVAHSNVRHGLRTSSTLICKRM